tara:strand:- start:6475 stop:7626 length:1152 start_codon:yes stop_codon:yes gene_type:complete
MSKDISNVEMPEQFVKIMNDFLTDILNTFPEYKDNLSECEISILNNDLSNNDLFEYCCSVYPARFFDILYKNEDMFNNPDVNTCFLPDMDFKYFFDENITEKTKETIWKYLQLVLFTISNKLTEADSFGDTAKLFEAIDEDELKSKMEDTMKNMMDMFDLSKNDMNFDNFDNFDSSQNHFKDMPNPEKLNEHINELLNGKLGCLAGEIAKETADELNIDMNNAENVKDVFEKLFKNPGKLLNMVKKVGKKLDEKLKSGEIKESELMEEASELMKKMKSMPGVKNMEQMFSKMGIPTGKNAKMNMNAMQANLHRNIKLSKQKERLREKLKRRQEKKIIHKKYNPNSEVVQKSTAKLPGELLEESKPKKRKKKKKKKKKKKQNVE